MWRGDTLAIGLWFIVHSLPVSPLCFFNDTATTEIYTLSLHDALPILLYAAGRPVFVADAYARRVLARHRLLRPDAAYEDARAFLEAHLPSDPALFNEFHALLVAVGKSHCRAVPQCQGCPLRRDLGGRPPARG